MKPQQVKKRMGADKTQRVLRDNNPRLFHRPLRRGLPEIKRPPRQSDRNRQIKQVRGKNAEKPPRDISPVTLLLGQDQHRNRKTAENNENIDRILIKKPPLKQHVMDRNRGGPVPKQNPQRHQPAQGVIFLDMFQESHTTIKTMLNLNLKGASHKTIYADFRPKE